MSTAAPATGVAIEAVLAGRLVEPVFQPIVELRTRAVVGLEALARGPAGSAVHAPDRLFAAARAAGRLGELDMLCAERALECAVAAQAPPPLLFINAEPAVLDQPISPRLRELVLSGLPFREVLEFTERSLPAVPGHMLRLSAVVEQWGNGIALDDVGVDPMSLAFMPVLEPEVIKLDMSLLRDPHAEHTRIVCAVVAAEARRTGAVVVAEGVETEADLHTALELGATWGQGWFFGRPGHIDALGVRYDPSGAQALRPPRPGFHCPEGTPFEVAAAHGPARDAHPEAVAHAIAGLRGTSTGVVLASCPDAVALPHFAGPGRSVILLDEPLPGEVAVATIGPGHARAVCVRGGALVVLDERPAVADVVRALLSRVGQ
ncbi:EAL domain-containing protein [Dactylosporangium sp. CA-139066]|uniref:EAL domain-containing protein n=1 Tax=Dactylosporangium sp. CA-139066 TaxID=3239930 RepID=UPI003D91BBB6